MRRGCRRRDSVGDIGASSAVSRNLHRRVAATLVGGVCLLVGVILFQRADSEATLRAANLAGGAGQLDEARRLAADVTDGTTAADAWAVRAEVALQQQRYSSAVTALRRSLSLRPNDWQARRDLAAALLLTGRAETSRTEFARSLALNPRQRPFFPFTSAAPQVKR